MQPTMLVCGGARLYRPMAGRTDEHCKKMVGKQRHSYQSIISGGCIAPRKDMQEE